MKLIAKGSVFLVLLALALPAAQAGQVTPNPLVPPNPTGDDTILKDLMDRMQRKVIKDGEGFGNVRQAGAALCDICSQPLFRHGDPNFLCLPIDPRTGKPRALPHIITTPGVVQCPVCPATFAGVLPGNINDRAGRDRDFCVHSIGKMTVHSDVWMCPDCGYAAMIPRDQKAESFQLGLNGKPVDEAVKKFVREKLTDVTKKRMIRVAGLREDQEKIPADLLKFSKYVPQNEIPDWIKYDNALQICEFQKAPHVVLARLYVEGAHACRREVYSEVSAPALEQELQEAMGKAITRMNRYVQSECLALRRQRGDPLLDPTKAEVDECILAQACEYLLKAARELSARQRTGVDNPAGGDTFFSKVDLFVLNIIHAGALDRQGKLDEADKALADALSFIPEKIQVSADNKDLAERAGRQLQLLRGIVQDRQTCLHREQEYLFKAARRNMAAIERNEVKFKPAPFDPKAKSDGLADPAPTAYLIGELMRRVSVPEAASAWFTAAVRIVDRKLELLEAAEKASPPAPVPVAVLPNAPVPKTPFEAERGRLATLRQWAREQGEQSRATKPADEATQAVIEKVLASVGLTPKVDIGPAVVQASPGPSVEIKNPAAKVEATVASGSIKSREQLYKMYYSALSKYHTDKKENPRNLAELVSAGYVPAADSCLDENGKLICPETKEKLMYLRKWEPGDKSMQVLIPMKPGSKTLFADGSVR